MKVCFWPQGADENAIVKSEASESRVIWLTKRVVLCTTMAHSSSTKTVHRMEPLESSLGRNLSSQRQRMCHRGPLPSHTLRQAAKGAG